MELKENESLVVSYSDLVSLFESEDFKNRLVAEYMQLVQNVDKLSTLLLKVGLSKIELDDFQVMLLREQHEAMCVYLSVLQKRLVDLNIDIPDVCFVVEEKQATLGSDL